MTDAKTLLARFGPREVGKPVVPAGQLASVRFSPCGTVLAAGDFTGAVQRWRVRGDALAPLPPLAGHHGWVQALAFHPAGGVLFAADSWGRLAAWPYRDEAPRPLWSVERAHDGWVRGLAVAADGKTVATCSADGRVRTWRGATGAALREWPSGNDVLALAFHPDGGRLAFGDLHGRVWLHDVSTGKLVRRFDAASMYRLDRIQDVGGVRCLAFDRGGGRLAAGGCRPTSGAFVQGAGLLAFFETATGKAVQTLTVGGANDGYVLDVHWHAGGFVMAVSSGQPGVGKLFFHRPGDAAPFFATAKMPNCHGLAVHPDGRRLVVAATNANSSGNGRPDTKGRVYPGNTSPLYAWRLPG